VTVNGRTINAMAALGVRGPVLLTTITGHLPRAGDQVALGAITLRQLGARIGSLVRVTMPGTRAAWFRVTGTTVFPPAFSGELGTGAVFTVAGWLGGRCLPGPAYVPCQLRAVLSAGGSFLVRAVPGPRGQAALTRLARAYPFEVGFPATPAGLVNFGEVNFPLIFGLVLALFGAAALLHLLVLSAARRRPEMGLLKALGFVRRQVAFAVSWQAATVALAGVVVGVPAGLVAGRLIWRVFAASLGVVPVPVVVAWVIVAVAAGTLIAATALAAGPAWSAARSRPAGLLRTE
jgi:putative ABC transport system permease protein